MGFALVIGFIEITSHLWGPYVRSASEMGPWANDFDRPSLITVMVTSESQE